MTQGTTRAISIAAANRRIRSTWSAQVYESRVRRPESLVISTGDGSQPARSMIRITGVRNGAPSMKTLSRRSEEHTSELQSRGQLVCRLVPEKKIAQLDEK